jgi:hypothetical protein
VDCYALAKHSLYPLGNTLCVFDGSKSALACCRVTKGDGDHSEKEKASAFKKLLELFGEWIVWASRLPLSLGHKLFGLKCKVSCLVVGPIFKRAKVVLRRAWFRVGSRCFGSKASSKHSDLASGSDGESMFCDFDACWRRRSGFLRSVHCLAGSFDLSVSRRQ